MNRFVLIAMLSLFILNISCTPKDVEIKSPSRKLVAKISVDQYGLNLNLYDSNNPVIHAYLGNFVFDNKVFGNGYSIGKVKETAI